jgi:hypothetical protein
MFAAFKPWFFGLTMVALALESLGYSPEHGLDVHLHARAVAAGKPVIGLESLEEQLDLFDDIPMEKQDALLKHMLDDIDVAVTNMDELVTAWATGDAATLQDILTTSFEGHETLYQRFVTDRNARWMDTLLPFLQGKRSAIVVVGAAHLVGPDGLVERLRRLGYGVEQL